MLRSSTLEKIAEVIVYSDRVLAEHDMDHYQHRYNNQIQSLFADVGINGELEYAELSLAYATRLLTQCRDNAPDKINLILREILHIAHFPGGDEESSFMQEVVTNELRPFFRKDGFHLEPDGDGSIQMIVASAGTIKPESLSKLNHSYISEQISKAKRKILNDDFDGAITNARTLIEAVQIELIGQSENELKDYEGDLNKLFQQTKKTFNLDPSRKDITDSLKQTLAGLNSLIIGLAAISNRMGDRHKRLYRPSKHHAKLVVNSAMTFCEFLVDSHEYQTKRRQK